MNAFDKWWAVQCRNGVPVGNTNMLRAAFEAGMRAGVKEACQDARDIADEASWKERQGYDYGSF
jgi:hypothetical protein